MHLITTSLKAKIKQGKSIGGAWMMTVNPAFAEIASGISQMDMGRPCLGIKWQHCITIWL